ncbi:MAG: hypothetical protein QM478_07635 [Flavobacteriaceae bacterium]
MRKLAFILAVIGLISMNGYSQHNHSESKDSNEGDSMKMSMMKTMKQNPEMKDKMMGMMMDNKDMRNKMHMMMMNNPEMSKMMASGDGMGDMDSKEGMMKIMKENPKMKEGMIKMMMKDDDMYNKMHMMMMKNPEMSKMMMENMDSEDGEMKHDMKGNMDHKK